MLNKKLIALVNKKEKEIEMSAIYQFDLQKMELLDVASDEIGSSESEE